MPPHGPATPSRAAAWCPRAALMRSHLPYRHSLPPAVAPCPISHPLAPSRARVRSQAQLAPPRVHQSAPCTPSPPTRTTTSPWRRRGTCSITDDVRPQPRSHPVLVSPTHASSRVRRHAPSPSHVPSRVRACAPSSCSCATRAAMRLSYALASFSHVIMPFLPPSELSRAVAPSSCTRVVVPSRPSCPSRPSLTRPRRALASSRRPCTLAPFSRLSCPLRAVAPLVAPAHPCHVVASSRRRAITPVWPVPRPPSLCLPLRAVFAPSRPLCAVPSSSRLLALFALRPLPHSPSPTPAHAVS
ncbi:hypothetical protein DENSPDRAFT_885463 [Dentipellis sp. KUC8613]|nr:hypothetical protein DENSPDRAFT_885463 [Dentipellis sp. KUC8613]